MKKERPQGIMDNKKRPNIYVTGQKSIPIVCAQQEVS